MKLLRCSLKYAVQQEYGFFATFCLQLGVKPDFAAWVLLNAYLKMVYTHD